MEAKPTEEKDEPADREQEWVIAFDHHMAKYKKLKGANKDQHEIIEYLKAKALKYRKQRDVARSFADAAVQTCASSP